MPETQNNFDLAIVTGFGDKGVKELGQELTASLKPRSYTTIKGCPWYKALKFPHDLVTDITHDISELYSENLLLVGHSYGALLALAYAMRAKMQGILGLVLIDGPLNLNAAVVPTKSAHRWFWRQYMNRPELAELCLKELENLDDASNIITIGSQHDSIVPFETKSLPGGHLVQVREFQGRARFIRSTPDGKPYNWVLPDTIKGHGLHQKISMVTMITAITLQAAQQNKKPQRMRG